LYKPDAYRNTMTAETDRISTDPSIQSHLTPMAFNRESAGDNLSPGNNLSPENNLSPDKNVGFTTFADTRGDIHGSGSSDVVRVSSTEGLTQTRPFGIPGVDCYDKTANSTGDSGFSTTESRAIAPTPQPETISPAGNGARFEMSLQTANASLQIKYGV
jgi:hypothetical protein